MKIHSKVFLALLQLLLVSQTYAATLYVDLNSVSPTSPYATWAAAATNIQDAIDAAAFGDLVLVTNGVYATGGKVMAGDLTNRVAIDKAITVQSVNGWAVTQIQGQKDPATNGPTAIRCVWLTNGASLVGFTLRDGATRAVGDQATLRSGGGVWASSTNALLTDCLISQSAAIYGGGVFRARLERCIISQNFAQIDGGGTLSNNITASVISENRAAGNGGGAAWASIWNSAVVRNSASVNGGGLFGSQIRNCTVTLNEARVGGGYYLTGVMQNTNVIIWGNTATLSAPNVSGGNFANSCSTPLLTGPGNFTTDPLLFHDGIHIATNSPCRGLGLAVASGVDVDGQAWSNPPSVGCDEWSQTPVAITPQWRLEMLGTIRLSSAAIGQPPFSYQWLRDGVALNDSDRINGSTTTDLRIASPRGSDSANYQLAVSNVFGVRISQVMQLTLRFVDQNSASTAPPYLSWETAATNIQEAVEASAAGDVIVVASGIYGRGGKVKAGDLTNRVALDKPVGLFGVSGPLTTIIQGAWDLNITNGPGAVRSVWMGEGACLSGFTVRGGAVRGMVGSGTDLQTGGGIWCSSTNASIFNCIVRGNAAGSGGAGGVFRGTMHNCLIRDNFSANSGAGLSSNVLFSCTVTENVSGGTLNNVAVVGVRAYNSIIWGNTRVNMSSAGLAEYSGTLNSFTNCCTRPLPAGAGNIATDPMLTEDGWHLRAGSPCINVGSSSFSLAVDLDGQSRNEGVIDIGCDEWKSELALGAPLLYPTGDGKVRFRLQPFGTTPTSYQWYKNGVALVDDSRRTGSGSGELMIRAFQESDAGSYYAVVINSVGVSTSAVLRVNARFVDLSNANPIPPHTNWAHAATSIQSAIDVADYGDLIVVANGNYATGGRVVGGDLANRVILEKAVTVTSLDGSTNTIIEGQKDPNGPNGHGDGAIRPVWLDQWTTLAGFTLRNGATRTSGDVVTLQSGGGIWAVGNNAFVRGCVITNNAAYQNGGGAFGGSFERCLIAGNTAINGGGLYGGSAAYCLLTENRALSLTSINGGGGANSATLRNSVIHKNRAGDNSSLASKNGGVVGCNLYNCSVTENDGNGIYFGFVYNTISWGNRVRDYAGSLSMHYSCANFSIASYGTNNLYADPQLIDPFHLSANSLCRAAGGPLFVTGMDWDGEAWGSPASIGADEFVADAITGPLSVAIELPPTPVFPNRRVPIIGRIDGRATRIEWSFGEGPVVTNASYATLYSWANPGEYVITFTAFNASHPMGVSTSVIMQVTAVPAPSWAKIENLGGYYRFAINTQIGVTNTIEFSTNLTAPILWMPLQTSLATNVLMREFDFTPTNAARFYRLHAQ